MTTAPPAQPSPTAPTPATLRTLLVLAWPIVLARATQAVIGFCDALMVAPLGEDALAAATMGSLNTMNVVILPMGTVFIVQSFAAQLSARGDLRAARRYAYYGLMLAAVAAVLAAAGSPFVGDVLALLDYTPPVEAGMTDYMVLRLTSVGGIVGTEALGNWFGGLGRTRYQMVAGFIAMFANIALNYLLIEGHFGAPAMGVSGAALASAIATWMGFGYLVVVFFVDGRAVPGGAARLRIADLKRGEFFRMLRFGVPNGLNWFLEFGAFSLFLNVAVAHLGTTVLAALNVVLQINMVSFMPAFGVASAGAILVGHAIGQRAFEQVWPIVRKAGLSACVWMATAGLVYLCLPGELMAWFQPKDMRADTLLEVGASMLAIAAAWQLFDAIAITFSEALRAAGDTTFCLWARVVLAWVVFTPIAMAVVFVWDGGPVAVMLAMLVYIGAVAALMAWRFRRGTWKRIDLIGPGEPALLVE